MSEDGSSFEEYAKPPPSKDQKAKSSSGHIAQRLVAGARTALAGLVVTGVLAGGGLGVYEGGKAVIDAVTPDHSSAFPDTPLSPEGQQKLDGQIHKDIIHNAKNFYKAYLEPRTAVINNVYPAPFPHSEQLPDGTYRTHFLTQSQIDANRQATGYDLSFDSPALKGTTGDPDQATAIRTTLQTLQYSPSGNEIVDRKDQLVASVGRGPDGNYQLTAVSGDNRTALYFENGPPHDNFHPMNDKTVGKFNDIIHRIKDEAYKAPTVESYNPPSPLPQLVSTMVIPALQHH